MTRSFVPVAIALAAFGLGCASLPSSTVAVLEGADQFQIMTLDPYGAPEGTPPEKIFHGHAIVAQADVKEQSLRQQIIGVVNKGVRKGGDPAKCFNPRHGVHGKQGGKTVDLVICFECSQIEIVEDGRSNIVTTGDVGSDLNTAFGAAGVSAPPE